MGLADLATPLLRVLPPEAAHNATIRALKLGIGLPNIAPDQWHTSVTLPRSGLKLPNPVGLAAGFDKNGDVYDPMSRFGFGFIECGTVTPRPQDGNKKPRLFRLSADKAVINRMGFNNRGLRHLVQNFHQRSALESYALGANVGANKITDDRISDYVTGITETYPVADYITINISSPNTPGLRGLQAPEELRELLMRCGAAYKAAAEHQGGADKPVFLKLAPDLDEAAIADIVSIIRHEGAWLSGLIISNTTLARAETLKSQSALKQGGLSGAPLFEASTAILRRFAQMLDGQVDLIGCGGVSSGAQAYAKIRAGAHAVQLYTALSFEGPGLIARMNQDLAALLKADGFSSVAAAVGADL